MIAWIVRIFRRRPREPEPRLVCVVAVGHPELYAARAGVPLRIRRKG